jgi:phage-related protein
LISKVPQIISALVSGLGNGLSKMGEVGKKLVSGLWNGISNSMQWIKDKIKSWVGNVTNFIKKLFGINSPSRLFRDEIGTNLGLGVGEGFSETMSEVSQDMANAIPTEFDTEVSTNVKYSSGSSPYSQVDMYVMAFKQALKEVKVVMNDREMGTFVTDTVERVVFA